MIEGLVKTNRVKMIWALAWPLMLSQILQSLLELVDMYFISNLGIIEAIAATGISTSILGLIIVLSQLVATGAIALISRKTGEEDLEGTMGISGQALLLALGIGIIVACITSGLGRHIVSLFGDEKAVEEYALIYLRIVMIGVPFTFFNLTGRAILQAKGDTKTPMIVFVFMNVINIILDPVLIYGFAFFPELGFKGAALATTMSNIFAFLFMTNIVFRKVFNRDFRLLKKSLRVNIIVIWKIVKIGFFAAIQAIARPITGLAMFIIAAWEGTEALAAFTVGGKMFSLVFIFLTGLNMAVSVLVGQNIGRRDIDGAEGIISDSLKLAAINMIVFAIPYFIFAKHLMLLFTQDMAVVDIGVSYLRITYIGIIFVVFPMVYGGAFAGAGDTAPPMVASLSANWLFKLPFAIIFSQNLGLGANGVWAAISISVIIEALIIIFWFKKGKWKYKEV